MTANCLWAELFISQKRLKGDSSLWCRVSNVRGPEVYPTSRKRLPHSPALSPATKGDLPGWLAKGLGQNRSLSIKSRLATQSGAGCQS